MTIICEFTEQWFMIDNVSPSPIMVYFGCGGAKVCEGLTSD